jgi:hypothetical protein
VLKRGWSIAETPFQRILVMKLCANSSSRLVTRTTARPRRH